MLVLALSISTLAKTVSLTLRRLVHDADCIVVAVATSEPVRGELGFEVRDAGHLRWETDLPESSTVTNELQILEGVRKQLDASSNYYASGVIGWALSRHQYIWDAGFQVRETLKGKALSNIVVRAGSGYDEPFSGFRKGLAYTLFLSQRHSDVYTPGEFTLEYMDRAVSSTNESQWLEGVESRKSSHREFVERIRALVVEEENAKQPAGAPAAHAL